MSYGIAIGDDGEVYEMGAGGARTKVQSDTKTVAGKAITNQKSAKKAKAQNNQAKAKFARNAKTAKKAQAKKVIRKLVASDSGFRGLAESAHELAMGNHLRNLPGIGDGLSGFGDAGESVLSQFGQADFGSLDSGEGDFGVDMGFGFGKGLRTQVRQQASGAKFMAKLQKRHGLQGDCFGAEPEGSLGFKFPWESDDTGTESKAAKVVGDALESVITKVIRVRARIQQGDDAFYARMRALPASDAKKKAIDDYTKKATARENGPVTKLYWTFANGVVTAMESLNKARAQKLKQLFDNPWMLIKKTKTPEAALKTLSGENDGLGLAPVLIGVGVAGAIAAAGTAYAAQSSPDLTEADKQIKAQEEQLAKDKKLLESKDIPEAAKVELAKSIATREASLSTQKAAITTARVEIAQEKAAAGPLGLGTLTANLKWVFIFGGAAVLAFMFLPQIKAMFPAPKAQKEAK